MEAQKHLMFGMRGSNEAKKVLPLIFCMLFSFGFYEVMRLLGPVGWKSACSFLLDEWMANSKVNFFLVV